MIFLIASYVYNTQAYFAVFRAPQEQIFCYRVCSPHYPPLLEQEEKPLFLWAFPFLKSEQREWKIS